MVRNRMKWRFLFLFAVLILNVFTKSLPIEQSLPALVVSDTSLPKLEIAKFDGPEVKSEYKTKKFKFAAVENTKPNNDTVLTENDGSIDASRVSINRTLSLTRNVSPGQEVQSYDVTISFDGDNFNGEVIMYVIPVTREDSIRFHMEALDIHEVRVGLREEDAEPRGYDIDEGVIEIHPDMERNIFCVIIEYSGPVSNFGNGIFRGDFNDHQYVGMNLFPTNARRVFPCMDELQASTMISFTFENVPFTEIVSNSGPVDDNSNQFHFLEGPSHLWGMVNHNFIGIGVPATNVVLYGRSGLNQHNLASIAINDFLNAYNTKLGKDYFEIDVNQDGRMHIFALPDTNVEWYALSTICIWEPYIFMTNTPSMLQQKIVLVTIAEAMARQWFGYAIYPEDWKDQWVISGLASYVAYDVVTEFQSSNVEDTTLLDMNTIFTTDVIQEALLLDSYSNAMILSPGDNIFGEDQIRLHISWLLKVKAPAILRMLSLILNDEDNDYILTLGQILLQRSHRNPISVLDFVDNLGSVWPGNNNIEDIMEFLEPWIQNRGYPVLHVAWRSTNMVFLTQEHFSFTGSQPAGYSIPITFTTNLEQNYDNVNPILMADNTILVPLPNTIDDDEEAEDYVIFNIQGQGYYRVNYDGIFWERIILALEDPDRRQEIHPLNRATLIDDALNLARAGNLDYDIALRLVLTWEHETEYAPWKAFIRSMEFLKHGLLGFVGDDEELDPDIYLRMVRRTMGAFEDEVSFTPDPSINEPAMTSLTRGMVMDHACRSNYIPCIAAAIDWFYDENSNEPAVNPNIPVDIQPAVFCTMVREAGGEAINLLYDYLETDITHYDRLVMLESLACSQDDQFINDLMLDTISEDSILGSAERSKVLAAIIRSRIENLLPVMNFMRFNTNTIRDMYGGPQKLEELLFILADNIVNDGLEFEFRIWVTSNNNNLEDSEMAAGVALSNVQDNLQWVERHLNEVYEWIDENDAPTIVVSFTLLCFTALISYFNF